MKRSVNFILGALLLAAAFARPILAQDTATPIIETEFLETQAIPGQPLQMRITVLVPTWLSQPVNFPTFEATDLMVRLFEKSTNPTSRIIDGETWSGISRVYQMSPMVAGTVQIAAQELSVLWAEPGKTEPNSVTVVVDPMVIEGIQPEGTEMLQPFIAATALTLTQELTSEQRVLKPGDSITRSVTVEVSGTSPVFVPALLSEYSITGLASYPSEPIVSEKIDETWLSGTRSESVTLVAESGGSGAVPAVEIQWFNITSGEVEVARIEGFDLSVDAPIARQVPVVSGPMLAVAALATVLLSAMLYLMYRFILPYACDRFAQYRADKRASEAWAFGLLRAAIKRQDYNAVVQSMALWEARVNAGEPRQDMAVADAMAGLGRAYFGPLPVDPGAGWNVLEKTLTDLRRRTLPPAPQSKLFTDAQINPTQV